MREYIHAHDAEFVPEGVDVAVVESTAAAESAAVSASVPHTPITPTAMDARKEREHERNQRSLQWAYDTLAGAARVGRQSAEGAIELVRDAWDQSSSTTILYFAIVFLVVSNLWTLALMGGREEAGRRKEMKKTEERERWVQGIVSALWEEMVATRGALAGGAGVAGVGGVAPLPHAGAEGVDWRDEVGAITAQLDLIEQRVLRIREGLQELD